ncbi:MAG: polysaccharide biosynthesis tyrosine autokinase [Gemmatimonadota bacterium]
MTNDDRVGGSVPVPYPQQGQVAPAHTYYYPDYAINQGEGEGLELGRLGRLLWTKKLWLLGAVAVGLGVGWGASQLVSPEYMTSTTLAIEDGGTTKTGPIQAGSVLPVDGWTDVFSSRAVLSPVVEELGLQLRVLGDTERSLFDHFLVSDESVPGEYEVTVGSGGSWALARAGESNAIEQGQRGGEIGSSAGFSWSPDLSALADSEIRFRINTAQATVRNLAGRLDAGFRNRSDIITAEFVWHDPYEAAEILNAITAEFVNLADRLRTTKIRDEVELLQEQSDLTGALLQRAELSLQAHRVDAITEPTEPFAAQTSVGTATALGSPDPMFSAFANNKLRADQLQLEYQQIEGIRADLSAGRPLNLLAIRMLPSAGQYPELQSAVDQLYQARLNRRTLLSTYTEVAPEVVQATQLMNELERSIIPAALARLGSEIQNQVDLLNRQIANQGVQLREIPQRTIQTARLQREVQQAAGLNSVLLSRLKEAELAEATSGPGITILNPAWPDPSPRGEKPGGVIALFALLGLGIGVAGVVVFDRFDRRIHSPDQVTGALGLPVLAVVPRLEATPDPASPAAAIAVESFRGLRTQIAHVDGNPGGVMLITSPAPREGKSMVSANLAISYATAGYRTLLLDGDTRRGRAQEMFNLNRSPGLTDFLMDRATLDEIRQETSIENLTLLARGAPGGFNADLLESAGMRGLLDQMREEYDVVVMDGPPLAAGADVLLLGSLVNKVVVVLRAGTTTEDLAKAKLNALGNVDLPIVGAVLNALPKSAPDYEYYVHYYYADAV